MSKLIHAIEEKQDPRLDELEKAVAVDSDLDHDHSQDHAYWLAKAEEERKLVRKIDGRILPIACLMYLFACQFLLLLPHSC